MKRNLVVEGMDGSGKTTLIRQLREWYPQLGEVRRACTSEGPIEDTITWVHNDSTTATNGIYDRHPLVSDQVYPHVLGMPRKINRVALGNYTKLLARNSVLIFCDPGLRVVQANIASGVQMAGVRENAFALYQRYHEVMAMLEDAYGMVVWRYDYRQNELPALRAFIEKVVL